MELFDNIMSPYAFKVRLALYEKGIKFDKHEIRTHADRERLLEINPRGEVPALCDGDAVLYDSAVICEYLDALVDGPLFPRAGAARWQALRWQALGDGLLDLLLLWRNEREREAPLAELIGAFELKTRATLQRLEREADALASTPFAIGHLALVCALGYLDYRFDAFGWRGQAPGLAGWFQTMQQRPSVMATAPVDG